MPINTQIEKRIQLLKKVQTDEKFVSFFNDVLELLWIKCRLKQPIYVAGNGGSATHAQHLSGELIGRFKKNRGPYNVECLNSDIGAITCIANDFGYEQIFKRQLQAKAKTNDVFVAFTTSGNSANIVEALKYCNRHGIVSIVFTGSNGGKANLLATYSYVVPSKSTALIQDIHHIIIHMLCEKLEDAEG
jgi:D-sedoheptulose 7-phosphate isomerase